MSPQPSQILPDISNPERSILEEAAEIVNGPRRASYGTPADNHGRTAALWSAYLGVPITARQVCMLNALQKISRDAHAPGRDNLVDVAGYAENAHLVAQPSAARPLHPTQQRCAHTDAKGNRCLLTSNHEGEHAHPSTTPVRHL